MVSGADVLQFGNIWVINMVDRSDKLDAMRLTASLSGFKFDVIPAVNGSSVSRKALPGVISYKLPRKHLADSV